MPKEQKNFDTTKNIHLKCLLNMYLQYNYSSKVATNF